MAPMNGRLNGHRLSFPFPGSVGTPADQKGGPEDPSIDGSEFGRMVLDARRKGFAICPKRLEPVGPAFEAYSTIFDYRPDVAVSPAPEPARSQLTPRVEKALQALGHLPWIATAMLLLLVLSRACAA
jgi:hypothetical protein